jgi:hypothetical protein
VTPPPQGPGPKPPDWAHDAQYQNALNNLAVARDLLTQAALELRDALFDSAADPQLLQAQAQALDELLKKIQATPTSTAGEP